MSLSRHDRIRGAVYGALVGDALGVPVEFTDRAERTVDPVRGMRAAGTWGQPAGTWSDDGALLLCTLEGLTEGQSPAAIGRLYVGWMRNARWTARGSVFDIGRTTQMALTGLADGYPVDTSSEYENGNGSLMRILPVGFSAIDDATIIRQAREISCLTHAHIRSQLACAFYCLVVSRILAGEEPAAAYAQAIVRSAEAFAAESREETHFVRILSGRLPELPAAEIQSSGYVMHTLEAALWCVLNHHDFAATVLAAVNLGGDTDTTGCVAGGLAGARHGIDAIPAEWIDALPRRSEIDQLIARFNAR